MKPRTVIILWLIALLLGVAVFLTKISQGNDEITATKRSLGQTLLPEFPAENVTTITLEGADDKVTLEQKDNSWVVANRDNYPADTAKVNELLRSLKDLEVTQGIEAGPSFAPRFGMDEESSDPELRGITATFRDKENQNLAKLTLGKNLEAASPSPFGGGATGRYVRNHEDETGFYAVSEMLDVASADPTAWLVKDFLTIEKIESVTVTKPDAQTPEWSLARPDEAANFTFTEAFPGVKTNTNAASSLGSLFAFAQFEDVLTNEAASKLFEPERAHKATITTFEGFEYQLTFQPFHGGSEPEEAPENPQSYLLKIEVEAELPTERKKPAEETEEDAKAADTAFTERRASLQEILNKTKRLEGKIFQVSSSALAPLTQSRTDLIDTTPEPETSAPQAAPSPASPDTTSATTSAYSPPIELSDIPMEEPPADVSEIPEEDIEDSQPVEE